MQVEVDGLSIQIGKRTIVESQSFKVGDAMSLALVGASGSGKTTLLNCIGRLVPASSGRVLLGGADATHWSERRVRRLWRDSTAFVLQDYGLIDDESVAYNVAMRRPTLRNRQPNPAVGAALATVGLVDRAADPVSELSGGERQRISIARAMYKRASLILADEPTASLDEGNRQRVSDLLLGETKRGATVIIATHDLALAGACDMVIPLDSRPDQSLELGA